MTGRRPTTPDGPDQSALIVLAAGQSRRAGRAKALVRRPDGRALLDATLDALSAAPLTGPRLVVLGSFLPDISALLAARPDRAGWQIVVCEAWREGMAASARAGLEALAGWTGAVMVALGDMPHLDPSMLGALLACRCDDDARIVAPCHQDRRGHPVVWGPALLPELARLTGDAGGREVIARHSARLTLLPADAGCVTDYDTPDALRAWETGPGTPTSTLQPDADRPI